MASSLRASLIIFGCLLCVASVAQSAEQLADPTRPAMELVPGLAESDSDAVREVPPAGLQSVIISSKREAAIINGVEVEIGGKVGDAKLIVVNETCVVLMGPQGRQVMHMFPSVSMTKNQLACIKRQGILPISKVETSEAGVKTQAMNNVSNKKKHNMKKRVVCVPEEIKDGSKK